MVASNLLDISFTGKVEHSFSYAEGWFISSYQSVLVPFKLTLYSLHVGSLQLWLQESVKGEKVHGAKPAGVTTVTVHEGDAITGLLQESGRP